MGTDLRIVNTIDAKGLLCPEPIMLLHSALRRAEPGEIVELQATDPAAERDVMNLCEFLGHGFIKNEVTDSVRIMWIRKRRD